MCLLTMVYSYSCISDGGRLCACSPWCALVHKIHTAAIAVSVMVVMCLLTMVCIAVSVMVVDYVPAHHGVPLHII